MKWGLIVILLLHSLPVYADEISDLKERVAMLEQQMQAVLGQREEREIIERSEIIPREEPRVTFKVKTGYNALSYQAERAGQYWREDTAGIGTSAELDVRLLKPLKFNLTFDGSIPNTRDSLQNSNYLLGNVFTKTRIRLYTGSPNLRYRVFESDKVSADMSLGYEFIGAQVRQRLTSDNISEHDDITGHGPRVGLITKFHPIDRWSFGAEAFYSSFFDVKWEVTGARNAHTEGHAFRWDLGIDYAVNDRFTVGSGYRGYLLNTDLAWTMACSGTSISTSRQYTGLKRKTRSKKIEN